MRREKGQIKITEYHPDEVTEADVQRMTNGGTNSTNMIAEIVEDDSIISPPPATEVQEVV